MADQSVTVAIIVAVIALFSFGLPARAQVDRQDLDCAVAATIEKAPGRMDENSPSKLINFFIRRLVAQDDQTNWARVVYDRSKLKQRKFSRAFCKMHGVLSSIAPLIVAYVCHNQTETLPGVLGSILNTDPFPRGAPRQGVTRSPRRRAAERPPESSRPIALAVFRLTTSSNLVGCSTGMSAGFAPRQDPVGEGRGASVCRSRTSAPRRTSARRPRHFLFLEIEDRW